MSGFKLELQKVEAGKEHLIGKFQLPMVKNLEYYIKGFWSSQHDLDIHAVALDNGKIISFDHMLSCYNPTLVKDDNPSETHVAGCKRPFRTVDESMYHAGDARTGLNANERAPDEVIRINTGKLPSNYTEVIFVAAVHPPSSAKFDDVKDAYIQIEDADGNVILTANLTGEWGGYGAVQLGSIVKVDNSATAGAVTTGSGWEYSAHANGANDLNQILAAY